MKRTLRNYGIITNGQKVYYNEELRLQAIADVGEGHEFEEVTEVRKIRASVDQFGYFFGGIIPECQEYEKFGGWTEKEIEGFFVDLFISEFIYKTMKMENGSVKNIRIHIKGSLSGITKKEMSLFIEEVLRWLANEGIVVKPSQDYHNGKYKTIPASDESSK